MRADDITKHIGEEWVTNRGSYNAPLGQNCRVRIEELVTVEVRQHGHGWSSSPRTINARRALVTQLYQDTGEPLTDDEAGGAPLQFHLEAKQLEEPWAGYWERTSEQRDREQRRKAVIHRLRAHLGDDARVGVVHRNQGLTLSLEAAEAIADLLDWGRSQA